MLSAIYVTVFPLADLAVNMVIQLERMATAPRRLGHTKNPGKSRGFQFSMRRCLVQFRPHPALGHIGQDQEDRQEEYGSNADPLADLHFRLGSPHQEVG